PHGHASRDRARPTPRLGATRAYHKERRGSGPKRRPRGKAESAGAGTASAGTTTASSHSRSAVLYRSAAFGHASNHRATADRSQTRAAPLLSHHRLRVGCPAET